MKLKECRSEACREGRCGLGDSALGSCKLRGKSGEEVILCLLRSKDRYGRKYAERICGKEDYVLCIRSLGYRTYDLLNMVDGVGYTGILGYRAVCKIAYAVLINGYVLKKCISLDRIVDVGLGILIKVDNLCIASALKVEYALVIPAVLVIAYKKTLGIGGKSGLSGSGKSEEECGVLTVHIGVCRAMHRCHACKGKVVVHHGEHSLLHLSAVPGVKDNLLARGEVEENCGLGVKSKLLVVLYLCFRCVVNNKIGLEGLKLLCGGIDKHILYEVCLPCNLHYETDRHSGILVGSAEEVHYVKLLAGKLIHCKLLACIPCLHGCGLVIVLELIAGPPNGVLRGLIHNDELILRRTSGVDTGHNVYCAKLGELSLLISLKGGIGLCCKELLIGGVVNNLGGIGNAINAQINFAHGIYPFKF